MVWCCICNKHNTQIIVVEDGCVNKDELKHAKYDDDTTTCGSHPCKKRISPIKYRSRGR